jgi:hypothetical protein
MNTKTIHDAGNWVELKPYYLLSEIIVIMARFQEAKGMKASISF